MNKLVILIASILMNIILLSIMISDPPKKECTISDITKHCNNLYYILPDCNKDSLEKYCGETFNDLCNLDCKEILEKNN